MKREIKFRAFSKKTKRIYDVVCVDFLTEKVIILDKDADEASGWVDLKYFDLMQFTGLRDKNGKEIYEGDMISHYCNDKLSNTEVSFWEGAFIAGVGTSNNALVNYNCPKCVEIVGNVYDNK